MSLFTASLCACNATDIITVPRTLKLYHPQFSILYKGNLKAIDEYFQIQLQRVKGHRVHQGYS